MGYPIGDFVNVWTPALYSTNQRIDARNVRQGGNDILAAVPQGLQAMWAADVLAEVAAVTSGPIALIAQLFRILFSPVIAFPVSILSCAVKERMYESSVECPVAQQTRYYARGDEVLVPIPGTVSIHVDGQLRHFTLTRNITWEIEHSAMVEKDGKLRRMLYHALRAGEPFDAECREIEIDGVRTRVRFLWEIQGAYTELAIDGVAQYFFLGNEAREPTQGTVTVGRRHFLIGPEIPEETPDCICSTTPGQIFHYDTGREIVEPVVGSRSFTIDGNVRHFESAKFVLAKGLGLSGMINSIPKMPFQIPTKLGRFTVQALELVNKHMSNVIRLALIVSGAVLLFFGHVYMGAGALLAVTYEYLDHDLGVIPQKVSLFMEKWMPTISMVGLLITGSLGSQVMAAATLLLTIPSVNLWFHHKVSNVLRPTLLALKDQLISWFVRGERPPQFNQLVKVVEAHPFLEESDAPLVVDRNLSARKIREVLNGNDDLYELNPAYLTHNFEPQLDLPKNREFTELTRLWDEVGAGWVTPAAYQRLFKKVIQDKRFILFVQERFPEAKRFFFENDRRLGDAENGRRFFELEGIHRNQFDEWIQVIAREKGFRSKEEFIANWVRQQLALYIAKIGGNAPIEGEQHLLRDAIEQTEQIIPFLLKPETIPVHREDALVKLAVEGGNYCTLAMKRVSREVLEGFTEPMLNGVEGEEDHRAFEREVGYFLQRLRLQGVQAVYKVLAKRFREAEETQDTAEDVHLYDAFRKSMSRGFLPMSEEELGEFTFTELLLNQIVILPVQAQLLFLATQGLPEVIRKIGIDRRDPMRNRTLEYLRAWVLENNGISAEEREGLLNGELSNDMEHMADNHNHPKWYRLFMVVAGILREKNRVQEVAPAVAELVPIRV